MDFRIRNIALLFLALVLVAGLASAQPGVTVKQVGSNGAVTQTNVNFSGSNGGPVPKAPTGGVNGTYKYWDGMGTGGSSTNYFSTPPYLSAPPNPQIAVGPDDIITIVNRTIAHYPNPNAGGVDIGVTDPYNNPPLEYVWLDNWLGLIGNTALTNVCPLGAGSNSTCVIDNASVRYDQMQGRFVVLFTVTDVVAHRSNFILIVSNSAQFVKCASAPSSCPSGTSSSPLFTPPVIAPIVGGTQTGGQNTANWTAYVIPINLIYSVRAPTSLGAGIVGVPNGVTTGGQAISGGPITVNSSGNFVTALFCPNGGPNLPLTTGTGGTERSCTNYFPTGARMGLDNDNIILTAPVLDEAFSPAEGSLPIQPSSSGASALGPYAGTRVVTLAKMIVYNAGNLNLASQPPACDGDSPIDCTAINLSDNVVTGTLTEVPGCTVAGPTLGLCEMTVNPVIGACTLQAQTFCNPIPGIFWEPDNLRGRALASFDSQVAPLGLPMGGVITPIDYLVGRCTAGGAAGSPGQNGDLPTQGGCGVMLGSNVTTSTIYAQPIVFSCPASSLFPGLSSVPFCGVASGSQVADQSFLGPVLANTASIGVTYNPQTVGQGFSAAAMTSSPQVTPVSPEVNNRLFVGDSRPEQVMFREGLLYEARSARLADLANNPLGTSTVMYDVIRTCATGAPNPTCTYSANGSALSATPPYLVMETEWTNGQNVTDPADDIPGFGFYTPMFDSPANVVNSGPTSPISVETWLEKLFVGMTTGGTSNLSATFNVDFPSLWDFRPGDDAYDTSEPYLDPYTGVVTTTVPCPNTITVTATVTSGSKTVTVSSTVGLYVGMFVATTGTGSTITLNLTPSTQAGVAGTSVTVPNPTTIATLGSGSIMLNNAVTFPSGSSATTAVIGITFQKVQDSIAATISLTATKTSPINGVTYLGGGLIANQNTLVISAGIPTPVQIGSSVTGTTVTATTAVVAPAPPACPEEALQCAGIIPPAGGQYIVFNSLTNLGPGMTMGTTATVTITATVVAGSNVITVPAATATGGVIFPNDSVTGGGITSTVCPSSLTPVAPCPAATSATYGGGNGLGTTVYLTSNVPSGINGPVALTFSTALPASSIITATGTLGSELQVSVSNALTNDVPIGRAVVFSSTGLIPTSTTVTNLGANGVIFLNNNITAASLTGVISTCLTAPSLTCTNNIPVIFGPATTTCPMIQWSQHGGASTDPNDGSLWLFGEFGKYRMASVPGPSGQWGTSVANYALDFPATDPYDNDNTYFTDVQPGTEPFFTWIQIAKNLGLAQPASVVTAGATGVTNNGVPACSTNGNPPVQPPPPAGTTTSPGSATLQCAQFNPGSTVTRGEMAYWVVRSQMDEQQVSNFLCATGGDPTGIAPCGVSPGSSAFTFGDTALVNDPFVQTNLPSGFTPVTAQMMQRYIEVMARRGYTKGSGGQCTAAGTDDAVYRFCPNDLVNREEMAVFIIRAKMNNVFPTSLSGGSVPTIAPYGDNFKFFLQTPYFSDVPNSGNTADYYIYIQKMRELRITNGTTGSTFSPTANLTRDQIATFVVRAFFL